MSGIIETNIVTQVAFIVKNIHETKSKFARFLGIEEPNVIDGGSYEITGTTYRNQPAPDANCLMAFFSVGPNVQIELIQPNGVRSCWQDHLDTHGEGLHHIAFNVKNMDEKVNACVDAGMECVPRGKYGDASGEYAYLDATKDLKCFIELLENYS